MVKMTHLIEEITSNADVFSRPEVLLDLSQLDQQRVRDCLKLSLALYLLRNSRKPIHRVMDDIFNLEIEVGDFVAEALNLSGSNATVLHGILANTLSVIPMGGQIRKPAVSPSISTEHAGI